MSIDEFTDTYSDDILYLREGRVALLTHPLRVESFRAMQRVILSPLRDNDDRQYRSNDRALANPGQSQNS
jgi:hypothetical protein